MLAHKDYMQELNDKGIAYGLGRDESMHPIVVMPVKRFVDPEIGVERAIEALEVLNYHTIYNAAIPGKQEAFTVIVDLRDVGIFDVPPALILQFAKALSKNHHGKMIRAVFVNTPWLLRQLFKIAYPFQTPIQREKSSAIYGSHDFKEPLASLFGKQNLEKRFGGLLPNKKKDFWPPDYTARAQPPFESLEL